MKEILINTIYNDNSTAYANEGENIVHEIINLFKAENNKHYIYIVSDGSIKYDHNDKISDIFLTRSIGNKTAEIIALVKEPRQLVRKEQNLSNAENLKNMFEKQKEYIEQIRYDKKRKIRVDEIFKHNTYHDKVQENVIYATFEADVVLKPKRPIFLTFSEENKEKPSTYLLNKQFINRSQTCYIEQDSNSVDFKLLKDLIDSTELWEDSFKKVNVDEYMKEKKKEDNHDNFLKLIHHKYYEPAFSNLFQHYFNQNLDIFREFSKEVLGIELNTNSSDFEIKREEHNIDILIRDSSNVIVIENKIKSGINGKKYDDYGENIQDQLVKYYNYVIEGISKDITNSKDPRYYDRNKKAHFFIFTPDYKHLDKSKFKEAKEYNIIEYSKIYNFYKKYTKDSEKSFDKYFIDFVNALYKHTLLVDSEICANKSIEDAKMCLEAGADIIGILVGQEHTSNDFVNKDTAKEINDFVNNRCDVSLVTHLTNADEIIELTKYIGNNVIQLHSDIDESEVKKIVKALPEIKLVRLIHISNDGKICTDYKNMKYADFYLLDSFNLKTNQVGGTGLKHDWNKSKELIQILDKPTFLAGGLNPNNVEQAIKLAQPYGVDVNSGCKNGKGVKDKEKVKEFVYNAKHVIEKSTIVIFSDLHYAPEKPINNGSKIERKLMEYAEPLLNKITDEINNNIKPDLALNLGDLVEDFNDHDKDIVNLNYIWDKFQKINVPFYSCIGNHDLRSMSSRKEVEQIMGYEHSTFSFDIAGMHIVILGTFVNNEMGTAEGGIFKTQFISDEDLKWLKNDLEKNNLPSIVCVHFGVAEDEMKGNWWFESCPETALLGNRKELKEILKDDKNLLAVFSGHQHWTKKIVEDGIPYYVVGSMTENINNDGIPDGVYFIVEFNGEKLEVIEKHIRL